MFYCDKCRVKNKYPESMVFSYGACEICGNDKGKCHDYPTKLLPLKLSGKTKEETKKKLIVHKAYYEMFEKEWGKKWVRENLILDKPVKTNPFLLSVPKGFKKRYYNAMKKTEYTCSYCGKKFKQVSDKVRAVFYSRFYAKCFNKLFPIAKRKGAK